MKIRSLSLFYLGVVLLGILGCHGTPPIWNGTWKLNVSKSSMQGRSFSIETPKPGEFRLENDALAYSFRCDGSDYPTGTNHTTSCLQIDPRGLELTDKQGGTKHQSSHWELSADGKTLTLKGTATEPDGSSKPFDKVYERISGTTGFAGAWIDLKRLESRPQILDLKMNAQSLRLSFPQIGQHSDCPLDGSDAPLYGPQVPRRVTMAIKLQGTRQVLTIQKYAGRVTRTGTMTISPDGRTLTSDSFNPARPDERNVIVYDKQ